jgi:hypothetical protein
MPRSKQDTVKSILKEHGRTFSSELGIKVESGTPSALFRWLCASILMSARISSEISMKATRALGREGWTTPEKLAGSTWDQRVKALNSAGYTRYQERTSTMLGDAASLLIERYGGDLRRLRKEAGKDPKRERGLLKEFKGLGDVGVDIFFREAQAVWDELFPFADRRALSAARHLGLGSDVKQLAGLVDRKDFPRFVAALVRAELSKN